MNYIKYIFNRKEVMQTISDLEKEIDLTRKERNLLKKDNKEIGNKIIVALEENKSLQRENKELKKEIKNLKRQLKEVK